MPKSVTFDRVKVIEDVMELFWEKGYNGTSMQDLVNVTGLNRSSFYNSFGDKFSLYEEALKHYQQSQLKWISSSFAAAPSPKAAIESLFKGISHDIAKGDTKGCMLAKCSMEMANQDDHIKAFLIANKERVVGMFGTLIKEAQTKDEISADKSPRVLAMFLYTNLQGLRATAVLDADLEAVTEQVLNSL